MKKILIIALLLMLIAPALALPDVYDQLRGRQMVGDKGAPWYADSAVNYFGTGKDAALSYNAVMDKLYFNDTDLYFEEDVTLAGTITSAQLLASYTNETAINVSIVANKQSDYTNQTATNLTATTSKQTDYVNQTAINVTIVANKQSDYTNQTAINVTVTANKQSDYINSTAINSTVAANKESGYTNETAINLTVVANKQSDYTNATAINQSIADLQISIPVALTKTDFAAGELNRTVFVATEACTVAGIREVHSVAETTATTMGISVQKLTGTQALNGGINVTTADISLKGAANTVQTGSLSLTSGRTTLAAGDRLGILCNLTGTNAMAEFRAGTLEILYTIG